MEFFKYLSLTLANLTKFCRYMNNVLEKLTEGFAKFNPLLQKLQSVASEVDFRYVEKGTEA